MSEHQLDLAGENGLVLTKEEQDYLVFCQKKVESETKTLDETALSEIGLEAGEIDYLKILFDFQFRFGAPPYSCVDDIRWILWELDNLPRTDEKTGKITKLSYMKSVCPSDYEYYGKDNFWNSLRIVLNREESRSKHLTLFKILRKIEVWCRNFEKKHNIVEKDDEEIDVSDEENIPEEIVEEEMDKPAEEETAESQGDSSESHGITDPQKGYLDFLVTTVKNDQHRKVIIDKMPGFSKQQASAIIGCLAAGQQELLIEVLP